MQALRSRTAFASPPSVCYTGNWQILAAETPSLSHLCLYTKAVPADDRMEAAHPIGGGQGRFASIIRIGQANPLPISHICKEGACCAKSARLNC